jgi:putative GTP pyrophosphokinase
VSPSLYTSVHYVIAPNRKTGLTCEIQVRTLAEELWGEVDHTLNYPLKSMSLACREQIKVLARVTSSCTRLVDAIFISHEDHLS